MSFSQNPIFHFREGFLQIQFIRFITVYLSLIMKIGLLKSMLQESKPADRMIFESTRQLHCPVHCSLFKSLPPLANLSQNTEDSR